MEETVRAEVAPGVSLDCIRRSEKAEGGDIRRMQGLQRVKKKTHHAFHAAAADVSTAVERLLN